MSLKRLLKIFTSLRLTVVLLAFGIILIFVGTLAQADEGLYTAQARYFKQWLVVGFTMFGKKIPMILPGGYLLGTLLLLNLIAAHVARFQFTVKKIGIHLAHGGIILLLVGQLTTDIFSRETQMRFSQGETKSYSESPMDYELVFVSSADATRNEEVLLPEKLLAGGGEIKNAQLPFAVRVKQFWKNSEPSFRAPMMQNGPPLTTNGIANSFDFHSVHESKKMDEKNVPTALVEIVGPKGSLGEWIVSGWAGDETMREALANSFAGQMGSAMGQKITARLQEPQSIEVNGKKYTFTLRPKREYTPFSLTLLEAKHAVYRGTEIPKDFRSRVRLENPQTGENREVEIFMNSPLRYAGLTFYQYQMAAGEMAREAGRLPSSTLQVVHNPGWLTPYIGCALVGAGLVIQFLMHLVGFLGKRKRPGAVASGAVGAIPASASSASRLGMKTWLPTILTGLMAAWFLGTLRPTPNHGFAYNAFGELPIVFNGRHQPLDSLARNSLLQIREKQTLNTEPWKSWNEKPKIIPAIQWLATVMMRPDVADQWPVFRIDNPDLISLLKLPGKDEAQQQDGKHYSWNQIRPALEKLDQETQRVEKLDASHRNVYERAVVKMRERLVLYVRLKNTVQPPDAENWAQEVNEYEKLIPDGVTAVQAQQAGKSFDQAVLNRFATYAREFDSLTRFDPPLIIPPASKQSSDEWQRTGEALLGAMRDGKVDPAVRSYALMATAFKAGDASVFNQELTEYRSTLVPTFTRELHKSHAEVFFNRMQPFYAAMTIYVLAGLLAALFWFNLSEPLRRSAVWLIILAFVIHTTGLIYRMVLEGRPPVTNLYSSAIFIGWGAVVLGLVLERFYRNGIGAVVASGIGFITLIIAHHLSLSGDTMEMMRAVLDTNFWLATHVVVVTLGYASTFVAGFLALVYVIRGVFTKTLDVATGKSLARMVYGIVCFATLFSFVGTVLGGIWADQSWGRFWGWDPKENGALIIVLWNALILHLRWGGMIRERGLINCAIAGNIVTSWSWFGVNMLGIGLHSYGFMDAAFKWLMLFIGSQIALIVLGCLPLNLWKSFGNSAPPDSPKSDGSTPGAPAPAT